MRLRQRDMRPVTFRPRISAREDDGTTYETWGEAEAVRGNVQPAGGRVMAEQYGERLSYMLTMYVPGRMDIAESSGAWVNVSGEDPDYKVVAVRPWGSHTVIRAREGESMTIRGIDNLMRKLDSLGGNSKQTLKTGVLQAAKKVQGDAKDLAPVADVDGGTLRNSIQATVGEEGNKVIGKVSTNVFYAPYVEFGTGQRGEQSPSPPKSDMELSYRQDWAGMAAQPYMYPAARQNEKTVPKIVANHLRKEIRKLVK